MANTPGAEFKLSESQFVAALCLWREARGESLAGKHAVFCVIRNRAGDSRKRWPSSLWGVVLQKWQFSSFNAGDPNSALWPSEANPDDWVQWKMCLAVANGEGLQGDPTQGANHYHDVSISPPFRAWLGPTATAADLATKLVYEIGRLKFYKL